MPYKDKHNVNVNKAHLSEQFHIVFKFYSIIYYFILFLIVYFIKYSDISF